MSSGIVQLIAIGAQDEHIMGEPEISFFTSTFKRHSNFSQSVEKQTIQDRTVDWRTPTPARVRSSAPAPTRRTSAPIHRAS